MTKNQWAVVLSAIIFLFGCQLIANAELVSNESTVPSTAPITGPTGLVSPDFELNGSGSNVDSIAFWEAPSADDVLIFTTSKASQLVEVWQFPFVDNEQPPLTHSTFGSSGTQVNGIVIDQDSDLLYVSVSDPQSTVSIFSLPSLTFSGEIINGAFDLKSEPNIDLLNHSNGEIWAYVSADQDLYIYNAVTAAYIDQFQPEKGLETVLADDLYQIIYIPDENDQTGVYAYHPDGTPFLKNGTNHFGSGVFQADAEGIALYHCPPTGLDDGTGFIVISDQIGSQTEFEFFDRQSWAYLGNLVISGVSNTDGIASTQQALPGYPIGIFAAINSDVSTVGVGWDKVFTAMGIGCDIEMTTQELTLSAGWNLISSNINNPYPALETVTAPIGSELTLLKNDTGQIFWPAYDVNQIGDWEIEEGYALYLNQGTSLEITGTQALPEQSPISLIAGWNMVSYLREMPIAIDQALSTISGELVMAKDGAGNIYWPEMAIYDIVDMNPGQGYYLYIREPTTLIYPANDY